MAFTTKTFLGRLDAIESHDRLRSLLQGSVLEVSVVSDGTRTPPLEALREFLSSHSGSILALGAKKMRDTPDTSVGMIDCSSDCVKNTQRYGKKLKLLDLPYEIRREIFKDVYETKKMVHLTHGPITRLSQSGTAMPEPYRISRDGMHLMLSCRQISNEVGDLVLGSNTFVLSPGDINFNATSKVSYPHSTADLWLYGLRHSTMNRVKMLKVHLRLPREQDIHKIAQGLALFPHVVITIHSLRGVTGITWLSQRQILERMCECIASARYSRSTVWDDEGNLETAYLFIDALPAGFQRTSKTAIDSLDGEEAWS